MPVTLRSGRSSSRPLVMYAGRPKAASPSPIRETTGPPAPSVAVGMRIRPLRSLTMATTVPAARPAAYSDRVTETTVDQLAEAELRLLGVPADEAARLTALPLPPIQ